MDKLINNYAFAVIDNEAGMEHISRLTTNNVDLLLAVSDPTRRGIQAASRIIDLAGSLSSNIGRKMLIVNQAKEGQEDSIRNTVEAFSLDLLGMVEEDTAVRDFDLKGEPTIKLSNNSKAVKDAYSIFEKAIPV